MSTGLKVVVALGLACGVLLLAATALVGSAVVAGGVATVAVRTPDAPALRVAIPGVLISTAAAAGGRLAVRHGGHHGGAQMLEHADPAADLAVELGVGPGAAKRLVEEMLRALEDCPDATLIEVEDGGDRVRVVKDGRYLRVEVTDGGELEVEVSLPIHTARRTAAHLLG